MIIKLPPLESELFQTWDKHVAENPHLANAPDIVRESFEKSVDDLFAMLIYLASY